MRDKEIPYGYQMMDGRLIEKSAESNVIKYIFQKTNSLSLIHIQMCIRDSLYPQIVVESKKNNIGLLKAVRQLMKSDLSDNKYIIAMDESFDNDQVVREMRALKRVISGNNNIYVCLLYTSRCV